MALTLGIIGYGYMGHWHLRNAPRVEGVSVVAAYDIDPEKGTALARDEGLEAFSSLNEFLASDKINTVLVSNPQRYPLRAGLRRDEGRQERYRGKARRHGRRSGRTDGAAPPSSAASYSPCTRTAAGIRTTRSPAR